MSPHVRALAALVGVTLCAGSGCLQASNCNTLGEMKCDKGMLFLCDQGDVGPRTWHPNGTCADDPLCAPPDTHAHCEGDNVVSCAGGWRTGSAPCGSADSAEGSLSTHCVPDPPSFAACVPPESMPDPACGGSSGERCSGTTLIYCIGGFAVSRTACLTCSGSGPCHGFIGDTCDGDGACVSGLVCRSDSKGVLRCTTACDPLGASPPGGPATGSASCLDVFRAGGPPPAGYYLRVIPPGTVLACVAGLCEWSN